MTIYVDNAFIKAKVRQHDSKWCHLLTDNDDPEELHVFAEKIGLKRSYFQPGRLPEHNHYDLTENKRWQAIAKGAVEIDIHDWVELVIERRANR